MTPIAVGLLGAQLRGCKGSFMLCCRPPWSTTWHMPHQRTLSLPMASLSSSAIQMQLKSAGVSFPPLQLKDLDNVVQASRAYAGIQTRRKLPPLVPEFRQCVTLEGEMPLPPAGFTPGQKTAVDFRAPPQMLCSASMPLDPSRFQNPRSSVCTGGVRELRGSGDQELFQKPSTR